MNDKEIGLVLDLASNLEKKYGSKTVSCAIMVRQLKEDFDSPTAGDLRNMASTAGRIYDLMPGTDESRYSMHDYADGIIHSRTAVDLGKLLALDDEGFAAAMIWLATDKREAYEDREHMQEPLEIDIWA